jgi:hypothetical protein
MSNRRMWAAGAVTVGLAVALGVSALAMAGSASAAPTGDRGSNPCPTVTVTVTPLTAGANDGYGKCPKPTPTRTETTPPPVVTPYRQQDIDINLGTGVLDGSYVNAQGPVNIVGNGFETDLSAALSRIFDGPNGVQIRHEALSGATVDRRTCSIEVSQFDLPWSFGVGTGIYAGVRGFGDYDLEGIFSFPTRGLLFGVPQCSIPRYINDGNVDWYLNYDPGALGTPSMYDVGVQAVGVSRLAAPRPQPCPTQTKPVWQPTDGSQGNWCQAA